MGVSITSKNGVHSFDMGNGGFFILRTSIAYALDKEFGENFSKITSCRTHKDYEDNDRRAEEIINAKGLDKEYEEVLDFLYASDSEGKASYRACGKIYELIKDIDYSGKGFRYAAYQHNDYEEFKDFLKDCYSHRKNMEWW